MRNEIKEEQIMCNNNVYIFTASTKINLFFLLNSSWTEKGKNWVILVCNTTSQDGFFLKGGGCKRETRSRRKKSGVINVV